MCVIRRVYSRGSARSIFQIAKLSWNVNTEENTENAWLQLKVMVNFIQFTLTYRFVDLTNVERNMYLSFLHIICDYFCLIIKILLSKEMAFLSSERGRLSLPAVKNIIIQLCDIIKYHRRCTFIVPVEFIIRR